LGIPIVGIEPAVTLTYRDEYPIALSARKGAEREGSEPPSAETDPGFRVLLLQEYLCDKLPQLDVPTLRPQRGAPLSLFGHCTERTEAPRSQEQWHRVFEAFGLRLQLETTGCCGMCGVYGHEAEHLDESRALFELSWSPRIGTGDRARVLAPGHSCRSQVKRCAGFVPRHPIEELRDLLGAEAHGPQTPPTRSPLRK
jgi:Fe-S oxidoreductase